VRPTDPLLTCLIRLNRLASLHAEAGEVGSTAKARAGVARDREAVLGAPSVPLDASGAGPKGMVALSEGSWVWGACGASWERTETVLTLPVGITASIRRIS